MQTKPKEQGSLTALPLAASSPGPELGLIARFWEKRWWKHKIKAQVLILNLLWLHFLEFKLGTKHSAVRLSKRPNVGNIYVPGSWRVLSILSCYGWRRLHVQSPGCRPQDPHLKSGFWASLLLPLMRDLLSPFLDLFLYQLGWGHLIIDITERIT